MQILINEKEQNKQMVVTLSGLYFLTAIVTYQPISLIPILINLVFPRCSCTVGIAIQTLFLIYINQMYYLLPLLLYSYLPISGIVYYSYMNSDYKILVISIELLIIKYSIEKSWLKELSSKKEQLKKSKLLSITDDAVILIQIYGTRSSNVIDTNQKGNILVSNIYRKDKKDILQLVIQQQRALLWQMLLRVKKQKKSQTNEFIIRQRSKSQTNQYILFAIQCEGCILLRFKLNRKSRKKQMTLSRFMDYLSQIVFLVNSKLLQEYNNAIDQKPWQQKIAQLAFENHYIELVVKQLQDLLLDRQDPQLCKVSFKLKSVISQSIDMLMNRFYQSIKSFKLNMVDAQIQLFGNYHRLQYMLQLLVNLVVDVQKEYDSKASFELLVKKGVSSFQGTLIEFELKWLRTKTCLNDFERYFKLFDVKGQQNWQLLSKKTAKQIAMVSLAFKLKRFNEQFPLKRYQDSNYIILNFNLVFKHQQQALTIKNKRYNINLDFTPRLQNNQFKGFQISTQNNILYGNIYDPYQILSPHFNFNHFEKNQFIWQQRLAPKGQTRQAYNPQQNIPDQIKKRLQQMVRQDMPRFLQRLQRVQPESLFKSKFIAINNSEKLLNSKQKINYRKWRIKY